MSTLRNSKRKANMQILKQTEEMKELRISFIVLSTKDDVLLPIEEAKDQLVFERQRRTFSMENSKTFYRE